MEQERNFGWSAPTTASTLPSEMNFEAEIKQLKMGFTMLRGMIKEQAEHFNSRLDKELGRRTAPSGASGKAASSTDVGDVVQAMRADLQVQRELLVKTSQQLPTLRQEISSVRRDMDGVSAPGSMRSTASVHGYVTFERHEAAISALQAEIRALHKATELASIKAGFLAVAASECSGEEKAKLFDTLKERERRLVEETFPDADALSRPSDMPPMLANGAAVFMEIDRSRGEDLGMRLGNDLRVLNLQAGLIQSWNATHPGLAVVPGSSVLVSVNGVSGSAEQMRRMLDENAPLRLEFSTEAT